MRSHSDILGALLASVWVTLSATAAIADDELTRSTWSIPSHEGVRFQVETWLGQADIDVTTAEQIRDAWDKPIDPSQRLALLADTCALVNAEAKGLARFCRGLKVEPTLPTFEFLSSDDTLPFERNNLRLIYARWLAQNQLYDEALEQIADLQPSDVIDPAALLFYQSIAHHRLLNKGACLPVVEKLLEQETSIPNRFATLAILIRSDIEPLETDSLDEISRLMDSIQVRLGHGRAGTRVRKEEEDVIAKLDKMIKQLEAQAEQASSSSSGQAGDTFNPTKPMEDSMPGGATGPGNVDAKNIGEKAGWGDLPPKGRQRALQQLGKDFPSHYREVIEEYFRKLAREGSEP